MVKPPYPQLNHHLRAPCAASSAAKPLNLRSCHGRWPIYAWVEYTLVYILSIYIYIIICYYCYYHYYQYKYIYIYHIISISSNIAFKPKMVEKMMINHGSLGYLFSERPTLFTRRYRMSISTCIYPAVNQNRWLVGCFAMKMIYKRWVDMYLYIYIHIHTYFLLENNLSVKYINIHTGKRTHKTQDFGQNCILQLLDYDLRQIYFYTLLQVLVGSKGLPSWITNNTEYPPWKNKVYILGNIV